MAVKEGEKEVSALAMAEREKEIESESERIAEAVNGRFCCFERGWLWKEGVWYMVY